MPGRAADVEGAGWHRQREPGEGDRLGRVSDNALARAWFGGIEPFTSFHWHGETFTIPPGGTRIAASAYCANQGFVVGKHLGLQCHVEMTAELIRSWYTGGRQEIDESDSPGVQAPEQMEVDMEVRLTNLNHVADRLYDRWITGLAKG